jgi:hypothetical protein
MPNLTENDVKTFLQRHLQRGIVTIVGSGLSCAEGLPSMGELSDHLAASDPTTRGIPINPDDWQTITDAIRAKGIEAALHELAVNEVVADFIRFETATLIAQRESIVVQEVFDGKRKLKLVRLFPHLPQDGRIQIVTTNYDRLIEFADEEKLRLGRFVFWATQCFFLRE